MKLISSLAAIALATSCASAQFTLGAVFDPADRAAFVSIAFAPASDEIYAYPEFGTAIDVYSTVGNLLRTIPRPGLLSNDIDLDVTTAPISVGGTTVPTGTLLVLNSEDTGAETLFALDPAGTVLAFQVLAVAGQAVGGAHHHARGTFFVADWSADTIREYAPGDGAAIAAWPVQPAGSPPFDIYFGDLDCLRGTQTVFVVSSSQPRIREFSSSGAFIRDIDVTPFSITGMSGIAFDDRRGEAWIASINGTITQLAGFPATNEGCPADWNNDSSVDGDDVVAFFSQWDENNADFNSDGGTDGDDVIAFFARWDNGC
jgi:hypothetical protein